ncbi:MAG: hypothetical protein ACLTG7_10375 [Romboutsia sp.]
MLVWCWWRRTTLYAGPTGEGLTSAKSLQEKKKMPLLESSR